MPSHTCNNPRKNTYKSTRKSTSKSHTNNNSSAEKGPWIRTTAKHTVKHLAKYPRGKWNKTSHADVRVTRLDPLNDNTLLDGVDAICEYYDITDPSVMMDMEENLDSNASDY
jgi:hypothetical protein